MSALRGTTSLMVRSDYRARSAPRLAFVDDSVAGAGAMNSREDDGTS
jgi:hypothetical protein